MYNFRITKKPTALVLTAGSRALSLKVLCSVDHCARRSEYNAPLSTVHVKYPMTNPKGVKEALVPEPC